ncbi:MAG: hypothetical protein LBJ91_04540 [Clostridiales Family XIII bacterium]|nr:hypothetical protein [Clostridiales Family XIII bacterium]
MNLDNFERHIDKKVLARGYGYYEDDGVESLRKILSNSPKDELIRFLLEIADEYEEIKQRIELDFNDEEDDEAEISKSIALIHTFVSSMKCWICLSTRIKNVGQGA